MQEYVTDKIKITVDPRNGFTLIAQYRRANGGHWMKQGQVFIPSEIVCHLTQRAPDGAKCAAKKDVEVVYHDPPIDPPANPPRR